jgi:hypothetical protein
MKYFEGITTIDELKKVYRKLCQLNHPDNGGNVTIMAEINNEYTKLFNILKNQHNTKAEADTTGNTRPINECPEEYINIISELVTLKGLTVELCGSWIWISGDTREHKDKLKSIGCRWASKKKMWYWRSEADAVKSRKTKSMDYIRNKYGSTSYSTSDLLLA